MAGKVFRKSSTLRQAEVVPSGVEGRSDASRLALETLVPHERAYRRSFADEVAIDPVIACRDRIVSPRSSAPKPETPTTTAEITISANEAGLGTMVALDVSVPRTCACCGGRGEVWSEPCEPCDGRGQGLHQQRLTVAVPAGVEHGDRFSFNVSWPRGPRTRVDVRVILS